MLLAAPLTASAYTLYAWALRSSVAEQAAALAAGQSRVVQSVVPARHTVSRNLSKSAAVVPLGGVTATTADAAVGDPSTRATLGALHEAGRR